MEVLCPSWVCAEARREWEEHPASLSSSCVISDRATYWPNPMSQEAKKIYLKGPACWGPEQGREGWGMRSDWGAGKWIGTSCAPTDAISPGGTFVSVRQRAPPGEAQPGQRVAWHPGGHLCAHWEEACVPPPSWGCSHVSQSEVGECRSVWNMKANLPTVPHVQTFHIPHVQK